MTPAEAYTFSGETMGVRLNFNHEKVMSTTPETPYTPSRRDAFGRGINEGSFSFRKLKMSS